MNMLENYYEEQVIKDRKYQNITKEQYQFIDCTFENCSFEDCKITGCVFVNCKFYNCNIISLTSKHSEIKNAAFHKCNLIGLHCWNELLPVGKYAHSIDKLENCHLKYNSFIEMSFRKFDFSSNMIQESIFEKCDLQESNFMDCRLEATQFFRCDIRNADFRDAKGYAIDILTNKIKQAKFSYPEVMSLLTSLEIEID
ncbi:MAG: pentapeptide repeat-containing protein [Eubacterium sp.]|nr:pentapeptide repeat-containing protein [Eubacterium sp.]